MRVCKDCGASENEVRWVTLRGKNQSLRCLACEAIKSKERCQKIRATTEGREKHREAVRNAHRKTRATKEGREKANEAVRYWQKENPDKANAISARRRALKLQRTPKWLTPQHFKEIEWFYTEAQRLTNEAGILHHVDHIVPLQGKKVSGLHVPWNLQILTATENSSKGNKL